MIRRASIVAAIVALFAIVPSASATTFTNPTPVAIPDVGKAAPYPSVIPVSGIGTVTDVNVTLNDFAHGLTNDVVIGVVDPAGQMLMLMDGVGGMADEAAGLNLTFDDAAAGQMPAAGPLASTSYKPTAYYLDSLPAPAPVASHNPGPANGGAETLASVFNGQPANGNWSLFVNDGYPANSGHLGGGWSLTLSATPAPAAIKKKRCRKKKHRHRRKKCRKRAHKPKT